MFGNKIERKEEKHSYKQNSSLLRRFGIQKYVAEFKTIETLSFQHQLSCDTPKIVLGNPETAKTRILILSGIHGDEPCGIIGFNELIEEQYFNSLPSDISVL